MRYFRTETTKYPYNRPTGPRQQISREEAVERLRGNALDAKLLDKPGVIKCWHSIITVDHGYIPDGGDGTLCECDECCPPRREKPKPMDAHLPLGLVGMNRCVICGWHGKEARSGCPVCNQSFL